MRRKTRTPTELRGSWGFRRVKVWITRSQNRFGRAGRSWRVIRFERVAWSVAKIAAFVCVVLEALRGLFESAPSGGRREGAGKSSRPLRFESLEQKRPLTTVAVWAPPSSDATPQWTVAPGNSHNDWLVQNSDGSYSQGYWTNGDVAVFPAAGTSSSPATVAISDADADLVYASAIEFSNSTLSGYGSASYYDITTSGSGSDDQLQIPTSSTSIEMDGAVADIAADIVSQGSTGTVATTGTGTLAIPAGTTASVNGVTVGQTSGDSGTLDVEGTLDVAEGGSVNVTNNTVLEGAGTINLPSGGALNYDSTAASTFNGAIAGAGELTVDQTDAILTLDNTTGTSSSFTGGTFLTAGTLAIYSSADLGSPASGTNLLTFDGSATLQTYSDITFASSGPASQIMIGPTSAYSSIVASIDTEGFNITVPGVVGGYGGLEKVDYGNLALGGHNTYLAGTQIVTGTVQLSGSGATLGETLGAGTGDVYVYSGALLDLNGVSLTIGSLYGSGIIENSNSTPGWLTVDTNDATTDSFYGQLGGTYDGDDIGLIKQGTATLLLSPTGTNYIDAGLAIYDGTLQMGSADCLEHSGSGDIDAVVDAPGKLDVAGYSLNVGSLNGFGSSAYSTLDDAEIMNSVSSTTSTFNIMSDGNSNTFGGRLIGNIEFILTNGAITLTNVNNSITGGTQLSDGHLNLGDGYSDGMLGGQIESTDEDSVTFDVATGNTETFVGSIIRQHPYAGSGNDCYVYDIGGGTLNFDATTQADTYDGTTVSAGDFVVNSTYALPASAPVTVEGGATLDLDDVSGLPAVGNVTLNSGIITDGTLNVATGSTVTLLYGEVDASIVGDATMYKEQSSGPYTVVNTATGTTIPANTVVFGSTSDSTLSNGTTVDYGTLQVYGSVATDITVENAAVLLTETGSSVTGSVEYDSSASSTIAGQLQDGGTDGGAIVTTGTFVVTAASGFADGSSLIVGNNLAALAAVLPGDDFARSGSYGDSDTSDTGSSDTGSSDTGSSDTGSSGSGSSPASPGLPANSPLAEIEQAGIDVLNVIADTFDATHAQSAADLLGACTTEFNIINGSMTLNNGERTTSAEIIATATTQELEAADMSVTAAACTSNYVQAEASGDIANIATFTYQTPAVDFDVYVLYVFANYTIEPGG